MEHKAEHKDEKDDGVDAQQDPGSYSSFVARIPPETKQRSVAVLSSSAAPAAPVAPPNPDDIITAAYQALLSAPSPAKEFTSFLADVASLVWRSSNPSHAWLGAKFHIDKISTWKTNSHMDEKWHQITEIRTAAIIKSSLEFIKNAAGIQNVTPRLSTHILDSSKRTKFVLLMAVIENKMDTLSNGHAWQKDSYFKQREVDAIFLLKYYQSGCANAFL